jgi:hypothetical protein
LEFLCKGVPEWNDAKVPDAPDLKCGIIAVACKKFAVEIVGLFRAVTTYARAPTEECKAEFTGS